MNTQRPRVLLADDHRMFAEGLRRLIEPAVDVVDIVTDGQQLLVSATAERPDVVVCDLSMPLLDGLEATRRLLKSQPNAKVVVLSMHADRSHVREAFQAGACGYVVKSAAPDEIETALSVVLRGECFASPAVTRHLVDAVGTPRIRTGGKAPGLTAADPLAATTKPPIRILIATADPSFRSQARTHLEAADDLKIVDEAKTGSQAIELAKLAPDVILMDLKMPEKDGVEAIRRIRAERPSMRILVVCADAAEEMALAAIRSGAAGYIAKDSYGELANAIRGVHQGAFSLPAHLTQRLLDLVPSPAPETPLTPREAEISTLVARGWTNQKIADRLVLSEATVRTHLKHIFRKLELNNRVELALYAVRAGMVRHEEPGGMASAQT